MNRSLLSVQGVGLVASVAWCGLSGAASAAYTLEPQLASGSSFIDPTIDGNFVIRFALTSDSTTAPDLHNSSVFRVNFSRPGVIITGLSWGAPYVNTGDALPTPGSLPIAVNPGTLVLPVGDIGASDIEFSNVVPTPTGRFSVGTILTLNLRLTPDFEPGNLFIAAEPDTFLNGFDEVPTAAGLRLLMVVVPGPTPALALGLAGLCMVRRRR
jgi:hypothetical protein